MLLKKLKKHINRSLSITTSNDVIPNEIISHNFQREKLFPYYYHLLLIKMYILFKQQNCLAQFCNLLFQHLEFIFKVNFYWYLILIQYLFTIMLKKLSDQQILDNLQIQKQLQTFNIDTFSCLNFHSGTSCNEKGLLQFIATCKSLSKMYLLVHLIPFVLFKRKKVKNSPLTEIWKLIYGFIKSMLFSAGYATIVRRTLCFFNQNYRSYNYPQFIAAIIAGVTLNFEPIGRQSQISLYSMNKTVEVVYNMALYRNYPVRVPLGECFLVSASLATICYHYFNNKDSIKENYTKVINKLLQNS